MRSKNLTYFFLIFLVFGCVQKNDEIPKDLKIEVIHTNEIGDVDSKYLVSNDSCYIKYYRNGEESVFNSSLSTDSVSYLYQFIKGKNLDRIMVDKVKKLKNDGFTISLFENGVLTEKSNINYSRVRPIWQKNFLLMRMEVMNVLYNTLSDQKVNVGIEIDTNVYNHGILNLSTDLRAISYTGLRDSNRTLVREFKVFPGKYNLTAVLNDRLNENYQSNRISNIEKEIVFSEGKKIIIRMDEGNLNIIDRE